MSKFEWKIAWSFFFGALFGVDVVRARLTDDLWYYAIMAAIWLGCFVWVNRDGFFSRKAVK